MKLKKFIVVSSVLFICVGNYQAKACVDSFAPADCYMFSVYNHNKLNDESIKNKCIAFWKNYTANRVSEGDIREFLYGQSTSKHSLSVVKYLQLHKDVDALHYLELINLMNSLTRSGDSWDYPSKSELVRRKHGWIKLFVDASKHITASKRLGSRYWLMTMRAAYYSGNRASCQRLWDRYAGKYPNDCVKELAEGYIASYWFKDGEREKAREYYAKIGDLRSLRWCFNGDINLKGIETLYKEAPNSVAFTYLIQDYVNSMDNQTDTTDYGYRSYRLSAYDGKADSIKDAMFSEMKAFRRFAAKVVSEGKASNPALWQSASAFFAYFNGENQEALDELNKADGMQGTQRMKDNIRAIRFLVKSSQPNDSHAYQEYVIGELKWLDGMIKAEPLYTDWYGRRNHYVDVLRRVVYGRLVPGYLKFDNFCSAASLMGMIQNMVEVNSYDNNSANAQPFNYYSNDFFWFLDSAKVEDVVTYAKLLQNQQNGNELQQYAVSYCNNDMDYFNELIGTKYMRLQNFEQAKTYLSKVSVAFISKMNIAPYMFYDCHKMLWFDWLDKNIKKERYVGKMALAINPKLTYCDDMLSLQQQIRQTKDSVQKADLLYQIANLYAQATLHGDCWTYLHYSWSVNPSYILSEEKEHYSDYAIASVQEAYKLNRSADNKVRCLFALAALSPVPWFYDANEYVGDTYYNKKTYNVNSMQWKSFAELCNFRSLPPYTKYQLNRCDNLKSYFDYYKK